MNVYLQNQELPNYHTCDGYFVEKNCGNQIKLNNLFKNLFFSSKAKEDHIADTETEQTSSKANNDDHRDIETKKTPPKVFFFFCLYSFKNVLFYMYNTLHLKLP